MTDSVQTKPETTYPITWQLILSVLAACLGTAGLGADVAYSSPAIHDINSHPNPFHLNMFQSSMGTSIIGLGGCVGIPIFGYLADVFGRRHMLVLVTLPIVVSYVMVTVAVSSELFIVARFLTGFFVAVFDSLPTTYISEISPPQLRGRLLALTVPFKSLGLMYVYALGGVVSWCWLSVLCSLFAVVIALCLVFMCESPRWLLRQKQKEEAVVALQSLRGKSADISDELRQIQDIIDESESATKRSTLQRVSEPRFYKPLLQVSALMILVQFVGASTVYVHSVQIFQDVAEEFNPFLQSEIATLCSLVGSLVCLAVVDRFGRKPLLIVSCVLVIVSLTCLGFLLMYKDELKYIGYGGYIRSACLMVYSFGGRIGIVPVPFVLLGELFPLQCRGLASGICGSVLWLFIFLTALLFPYANLYLHAYGTYWAMAAFAFIFIVFTVFCVPETKGKTLEQIELDYK